MNNVSGVGNGKRKRNINWKMYTIFKSVY